MASLLGCRRPYSPSSEITNHCIVAYWLAATSSWLPASTTTQLPRQEEAKIFLYQSLHLRCPLLTPVWQEDGAAGPALGDHPGRPPSGLQRHRHGRENRHPPEARAAPGGVGVGVGGRLIVVVRRVPGHLGGGRVVPAVRRGELPLRPQGVRLPPQRPPRHGVPQVPVAAQPALLPAKVRRAEVAEDVAWQDGGVRGRLAGGEPVRVAAVHAPRRGARRPDQRVVGVRVHHRPFRGLRCDSGVLLVALPSRPRRRQGWAHRPQDRRGGRRPQVARRRRARLRFVALVGAQELGLHPGWQHGRAGHGPDPGLHQGAPSLGQMGRRQPPPNHHQSLLPGILSQSPQRPRMGGAAGEDVLGGDAAGARRRGVLPRPAQPAGRDREEGLGGHVEAGAAIGHHLHVAAEEGRAHHQVQRGQRRPRHGLHPLVRRRRPGHLEHPLLLLGSHCREHITVLS